MKTKYVLSFLTLVLLFLVDYTKANQSDPLVFVTEPTIPGSLFEGGSPQTYVYTIKNELSTDSLPLDISLVPNTDSRISIPSTTCAESLKPKATCNIDVQINPSSSGKINETLTIQYSPRYGALESVITIDITAIPPVPAVLQFTVLPHPPSQVIIGDGVTEIKYEVTNVGQQTAEGINSAITQSQPMSPAMLVTVNQADTTCTNTLSPGATCTYAYNIQAPLGTYSTEQYEYLLSVNYIGAAYPLISNIDFNVVQVEAFLNFSVFPANLPPAVTQGGVSANFDFVIQNYGAASAIIGNITNTLNPPTTPSIVQVVSDQCSGQTLQSAQTCTITLNLNAQSATEGDYTNVLSIPYSNPTTSPLKTEFAFAVVSGAPILSLSIETIEAIEIANPPTPGSVTFTLTNLGDAAATDLNPAIDLDYGFINLQAPGMNACNTTIPFDLPAGQSCTLTYDISPIVVGTSSQNLEIDYDILPGFPYTVYSPINFYAYTATPSNAYVSNTSLTNPNNNSYMSVCPIDPANGTLSCTDTVSIVDVTSIDFTDFGGGTTYGFTSAYGAANQYVQSCTINPLSCSPPINQYGGGNSYFIKFYTPTLAYLGDTVDNKVLLCDVPDANTFGPCQNPSSLTHINNPRAMGLLNLEQDYAYIVNTANLDSLYVCTINTATGIFTGCVDSGQSNLFAGSYAIDFISAGKVYAYLPLQVNLSTSIDIVQCPVNVDGTLGGCVSAWSKIFGSQTTITGIKVTSINEGNGNPIIYLAYFSGNHYFVDLCEILPSGSLNNCQTTGNGFSTSFGFFVGIDLL